jgi:hypothetical protein
MSLPYSTSMATFIYIVESSCAQNHLIARSNIDQMQSWFDNELTCELWEDDACYLSLSNNVFPEGLYIWIAFNIFNI